MCAFMPRPVELRFTGTLQILLLQLLLYICHRRRHLKGTSCGTFEYMYRYTAQVLLVMSITSEPPFVVFVPCMCHVFNYMNEVAHALTGFPHVLRFAMFNESVGPHVVCPFGHRYLFTSVLTFFSTYISTCSLQVYPVYCGFLHSCLHRLISTSVLLEDPKPCNFRSL